MDIYNTFITAINTKRVVSIEYDSYEKGIISRLCIPFDYGMSRRYKDGKERYHLYSLDGPNGSHNISILPEQLLSIRVTNEHFEPSDYITWDTNWIVERDWGEYS